LGSSGVWAGIINGTYDPSAPVVENDWGISFDTGPDSINFHGVEWSGNEWLAGVEGEINGNLLAGTAAGTYADGDFSGAGAGVWVNEALADTVGDAIGDVIGD